VGVAVAPDGGAVCAANSGSGNVSVINTRTNQAVRVIPAGQFPTGVAVTPDGGSVDVANELAHNVTVVNARRGAVQATIQAPSPFGVAISPDGHRAYVTDLGPGKLTVIDTRTRKVFSTVALGGEGTDPSTARAAEPGELGPPPVRRVPCSGAGQGLSPRRRRSGHSRSLPTSSRDACAAVGVDLGPVAGPVVVDRAAG
jgi:YVTN family beta-propeller protein